MDKHVKTTLVKTDAHDVTRFRLSLIIYVLSHDQLRAASLIGRNTSRDVEHYRMFTASRSTADSSMSDVRLRNLQTQKPLVQTASRLISSRSQKSEQTTRRELYSSFSGLYFIN